MKNKMSETTEHFVPFIRYDEKLDAIEIITADDTMREAPVSSNLVLFQRRSIDDGYPYVGFRISGAMDFCQKRGLPVHGKATISEILLSLYSQERDPRASLAIKQVAFPMLDDYDLNEFEFP